MKTATMLLIFLAQLLRICLAFSPSFLPTIRENSTNVLTTTRPLPNQHETPTTENKYAAQKSRLYPIIPNYIHYLRLNETEFTFLDAVCMLSAYRNHIPTKIYIHTSNSSFSGPFWRKIRETRGLRLVLKVIPVSLPKRVSQRNVRNFLKLKILAKYGGIFLEKDVFVVNHLDMYLTFESTMTYLWNDHGHSLGDQILIAARNSRFLQSWLKAYKVHNWVTFNSLKYAQDVLLKRYHRHVHVEQAGFLVDSTMMNNIYNVNHNLWEIWRDVDALWLMEDHLTPQIQTKIDDYTMRLKLKKNREVEGNVDNTNSFFDMVKDVYY